jgi:hypothetical protein
MVDPRVMCKDHLLGEHKEIHMMVGAILAGKSIEGYILKGQIEVQSIKERHFELVYEMVVNRHWKHKTPLPKFTPFNAGHIDRDQSRRDLFGRCWECRDLMDPPIKNP